MKAPFRPWPPSLCGPSWGLAEVANNVESFADPPWTDPGSSRETEGGCGREILDQTMQEIWDQAHTPET